MEYKEIMERLSCAEGMSAIHDCSQELREIINAENTGAADLELVGAAVVLLNIFIEQVLINSETLEVH